RVGVGGAPVAPNKTRVTRLPGGGGPATWPAGGRPPLPAIRLTAKGRRLCLIHGLSSLLGPWSAHGGATATSCGSKSNYKLVFAKQLSSGEDLGGPGVRGIGYQAAQSILCLSCQRSNLSPSSCGNARRERRSAGRPARPSRS